MVDFGYAVGDVIAIVKLAREVHIRCWYRSTFKIQRMMTATGRDAPEEYRHVSNMELRGEQ